jgi:spermidine/putrescine-binding protein
VDLLASGAVWVSYCYSGDTYQLSRKQPSIRYQVPPHGTITGIDSFCIPKGSRNPELAHAFINYLLEPEVAARISTELLYATPNEAARPFMEARLLEDAAIYPPEPVIKKSEVLLDVGEFTQAYKEAWARIRGHQKN